MGIFKKRVTEDQVRQYAALLPQEIVRCEPEIRQWTNERGGEYSEESIVQKIYQTACARALKRVGLSQDDWHDVLMLAHKLQIPGFDGNIKNPGNYCV